MCKQSQIYFSSAIRNLNNVNTIPIKTIINMISKYGNILTKHMADLNTVDLNKSDNEIYEYDKKLLEISDFVIADITSGSIGVGFMIACGLHINKPILCLYDSRLITKPSAMINGCDNLLLSVMSYDSIEKYNSCVMKFILSLNPIQFVLIGPPGSGKSTIGRKLESEYGIKHISTGDLVRQIVKSPDNPLSLILNSYMSEGKLIPANIMKDIALDRISQSDCKKYGYSLDGYPPSFDDLQCLIKSDSFNPTYILYFNTSDSTAIARQTSRNERSTDKNMELIIQRMDEYHNGIPNLTKLQNEWFPNTIFVEIDAEKTECTIYNYISKIIQNKIIYSENSFYPIESPDLVLGTRFHFHIDAENIDLLMKIINNIYIKFRQSVGQIKIYPIQYLRLGSQSTDVIYDQMMNFHTIDESSSEAFATCKCGEEFNYNFFSSILQVAKTNDITCMIEAEEYIVQGSFQIVNFTKITELLNIYDKQIVNMDSYNLLYNKELNKNMQAIELHLGFDIVKTNLNSLPISLDILCDECSKVGILNGGWFIFKNSDNWQYRSNEFSNLSTEDGTNKLLEQKDLLFDILIKYIANDINTIDVSFSLEIVHGIYQFNK